MSQADDNQKVKEKWSETRFRILAIYFTDKVLVSHIIETGISSFRSEHHFSYVLPLIYRLFFVAQLHLNSGLETFKCNGFSYRILI